MQFAHLIHDISAATRLILRILPGMVFSRRLRQESADGCADDLAGRIAEYPFGCRIEGQDATVGVGDDVGILHGLDDGTVACLAVRQRMHES